MSPILSNSYKPLLCPQNMKIIVLLHITISVGKFLGFYVPAYVFSFRFTTAPDAFTEIADRMNSVSKKIFCF